jgi:hypothetical protein
LTNVALVRSKVGELRDTIKACEEDVVIVRQFVAGASGDGGDNGGGEGMSCAETGLDFDVETAAVGTGKVRVSAQDGSPAWTYQRPSIWRETFKGVGEAWPRFDDPARPQ